MVERRKQQGRATQDALQGRGPGFSDYMQATQGFRMDAPLRGPNARGLPSFGQSFGRGVVGDNVANRIADARGQDTAAIQARHDRLKQESPAMYYGPRAAGTAAAFALPFAGKARAATWMGGALGGAARVAGTNAVLSAADRAADPDFENSNYAQRYRAAGEKSAAGDVAGAMGERLAGFGDIASMVTPLGGRAGQGINAAAQAGGEIVRDQGMRLAAGIAGDPSPPTTTRPAQAPRGAAQAATAPAQGGQVAQSDAIARQLGISDQILGVGRQQGARGSQPQQQAPAALDELKEALSGLSVRQAMELARTRAQTTPAAPKPPGFRDLFGREAYNNIQMNLQANLDAAETDEQRRAAQKEYQDTVMNVVLSNPFAAGMMEFNQ